MPLSPSSVVARQRAPTPTGASGKGIASVRSWSPSCVTRLDTDESRFGATLSVLSTSTPCGVTVSCPDRPVSPENACWIRRRSDLLASPPCKISKEGYEKLICKLPSGVTPCSVVTTVAFVGGGLTLADDTPDCWTANVTVMDDRCDVPTAGASRSCSSGAFPGARSSTVGVGLGVACVSRATAGSAASAGPAARTAATARKRRVARFTSPPRSGLLPEDVERRAGAEPLDVLLGHGVRVPDLVAGTVGVVCDDRDGLVRRERGEPDHVARVVGL